MAISQAVASALTQRSAQTYATLDTMSIGSLAAGDYLAVFSGVFYGTKNDLEYLGDVAIFNDGVRQNHTTRHISHEGSYDDATRWTLVTHCAMTVAASGTIDVRWQSTNAAFTVSCLKRTLTVVPVPSFRQVTATDSPTTSSTDWSATLMTDATAPAGTYLLLWSGTFNGGSLADADYGVRTYVNNSHTGYEHTERLWTQEASYTNQRLPMFLAHKVTPSAGQDIDIRWAIAVGSGTLTANERTLTLIPVAAGEIFEATATGTSTSTSTAYELVNTMDIVDPGANDYLGLFSTFWSAGTLPTTVGDTTFTFYEGAVQDTDSEKHASFEESGLTGDYLFGASTGKFTLGATDDLEIWWKYSLTSVTRTVYERTIVAIVEPSAAEGGTLPMLVMPPMRPV